MIINVYSRVLFFLIIWILYLSFMNSYAPLGIEWTQWNFQRIYNFSEYLKINGYFSSYGFSVWSKCEDCDLRSDYWEGGIYLSHNLIFNLPYILINHFFGKEGLLILGPITDKLVIFLTALFLTEIILDLTKKKYKKFNNFLISFILFLFFIVNPWTYKMIITPWYFVYFLFFFVLGILFIIKDKFNFAIFAFVICSFIDEQSAIGLILFYFLIIKIPYFKNKNLKHESKSIIPTLTNEQIKLLFFAFLIPALINISIMLFASLNLDNAAGSSLLQRIGISGNDIHNGGLVGSMQFLAGNRFTSCILNYNGFDLFNSGTPLIKLIEVYNCFLSHVGMFLMSVLSIFGIIVLYKKNKEYRVIILPISFLVISYSAILQQSTSVHLMGYSYLFSIIFALGIMSVILNILENKNLNLTKIVLVFPLIVGILLLCIRVSMLTGVNG